MAAECTHGNVVEAAGAITVAESLIGLIELPKRAEDWMLHNIMGCVVSATADAAQFIGGHLRMESPSGDVTPDPAPSRWPVYANGSHLGALVNPPLSPLQRYDIDLRAAGKANINLQSNLAIACTTTPRWVAGISYGPNIPEQRRAKFCDHIRGTVSLAARTNLGQIALSEKATRIVSIMGYIATAGVLVAGEEIAGFFDLSSEDTDLLPSQWMFNELHGAGLGATMANTGPMPPQPHIVDIPVIGGADIDVFVTLGWALTNPAAVDIFVMYE